MSIETVMPSNHLILCRSLLLLPSIFPNIRCFSRKSNILSWRIPWTEEPGRLQYMRSQRVRHAWVTFTSLFQLSVCLSFISLYLPFFFFFLLFLGFIQIDSVTFILIILVTSADNWKETVIFNLTFPYWYQIGTICLVWCVYPWRMHVDVWQNQYNMVK